VTPLARTHLGTRLVVWRSGAFGVDRSKHRRVLRGHCDHETDDIRDRLRPRSDAPHECRIHRCVPVLRRQRADPEGRRLLPPLGERRVRPVPLARSHSPDQRRPNGRALCHACARPAGPGWAGIGGWSMRWRCGEPPVVVVVHDQEREWSGGPSSRRSLSGRELGVPGREQRASSGWVTTADGCGCSRDRCVLPASPPAGVLPIWRRPPGPSPNREWGLLRWRGIARSRRTEPAEVNHPRRRPSHHGRQAARRLRHGHRASWRGNGAAQSAGGARAGDRRPRSRGDAPLRLRPSARDEVAAPLLDLGT
jgi:hypothetical protein